MVVFNEVDFGCVCGGEYVVNLVDELFVVYGFIVEGGNVGYVDIGVIGV